MGWFERTMSTVAAVCVLAAVSVLVARSDESGGKKSATATVETAAPTQAPAVRAPATTTPTKAPALPRTKKSVWASGAAETLDITALRQHPYLKSKGVAWPATGTLLPIYERYRAFYKVMTPNDVVGWVHSSKVRVHSRPGRSAPKSLAAATIVIDPGHGGHLPGAKGKGGYPEADVNLSVSKRLGMKLAGGPRVFFTRDRGHASLRYRTELANRLGAHLLLSVHNNALPDVLSKKPGSEVYHQARNKDSKRLAGLIYEELIKTFRRYKIKWGRDPFAGAKYRLSHEHGGDYYAILRQSRVPAVISEGMFITNPDEEALLRQPRVRQAYADAFATALTRYFETKDKGSGYTDPYKKPTPNCPIPGCFEHRK